jgi:hypothetical protein
MKRTRRVQRPTEIVCEKKIHAPRAAVHHAWR